MHAFSIPNVWGMIDKSWLTRTSTNITKLWSLQSSHRVTLSGLPKACASDEKIHAGNVDSSLPTSFKDQNNSTRTQKQEVKSLLELLGKFQMPN